MAIVKPIFSKSDCFLFIFCRGVGPADIPPGTYQLNKYPLRSHSLPVNFSRPPTAITKFRFPYSYFIQQMKYIWAVQCIRRACQNDSDGRRKANYPDMCLSFTALPRPDGSE